jgi:lipopolysaccharide transport system ATP-binding protein
MSSDIAIKVESLSKCYQIYNKPSDRLKQFILPKLQRILDTQPVQYYKEFWALKDVSFEVKRGETVGIIGRNGSGKSTLLQMICGTLNQTSGSIKTNGRIGALLELGSGFNPEFTGRENVYLNATVLGLSKEEIDSKFSEIVDFADIGIFIDQPVKTYSSGMMVRLAFAVQAQVNPKILIVDEALSVGDVKFQARCFERLKQLKEAGTSILLVTHSTEQIVMHCSSALLLDSGRIIEIGNSKKVTNVYLDMLFGKPQKKIEIHNTKEEFNSKKRETNIESLSTNVDVFSTRNGYNALEYRWGDGAAKITDFWLYSDDKEYPSQINTGNLIELSIAVKFIETLNSPIFGITIKTKEGVAVYGTNTENLEILDLKSKGLAKQTVIIKIRLTCRLAPGDYFISLGIATRDGENIIPHDRRYDAIHFQVRSDTKFFGLVNTDLTISIEDVNT